MAFTVVDGIILCADDYNFDSMHSMPFVHSYAQDFLFLSLHSTEFTIRYRRCFVLIPAVNDDIIPDEWIVLDVVVVVVAGELFPFLAFVCVHFVCFLFNSLNECQERSAENLGGGGGGLV